MTGPNVCMCSIMEIYIHYTYYMCSSVVRVLQEVVACVYTTGRPIGMDRARTAVEEKRKKRQQQIKTTTTKRQQHTSAHRSYAGHTGFAPFASFSCLWYAVLFGMVFAVDAGFRFCHNTAISAHDAVNVFPAQLVFIRI